MTHILEFDFRHSWVYETLQALDRGVEKLVNDRLDGLDLLEHVDDIVGLGFVALQTYIGGTEADLRAVFPPLATSSRDLRAKQCKEVSGVSCVEAIWAAANFYKHHDQWPDWRPTGSRKDTVNTLARLGIVESTEFPCVEVQRALQTDSTPLVGLLDLVSDWRENWLSHLRIAALPNQPLQRT